MPVIGDWLRKMVAAATLPPPLSDLTKPQNLRQFINRLPMGALFLDESGVIVSANPKAADILGTRDLVGSEIHNIIYDHEILDAIDQLMVSDAFTSKSLPLVKRDILGGFKTQIHMTRLPSGLLILIEPPTHITAPESEAMARIVHELKTPLAAMKVITENLEDEVENPEALETIQRLKWELERLIHLIGDFISLLRLDRGIQSFKPTSIELSSIIRDALWEIGYIIRDRNIKLEPELEENVIITGSRGLIKSLILNLLDNAIKHAPDGDKVIVRLKKEDDHAVIEVENHGPSLDPAAKRQIFRPYFTTSGQENKNMGLGLRIVAEVVKWHNGKIEVLDAKPQGVVFRILLPLEDKTDEKAKMVVTP